MASVNGRILSHAIRDFDEHKSINTSASTETTIFPVTPPASIGDHVEDMLNKLAELTDRLKDIPLTPSIRQAGRANANANANAKIWLKDHPR